MSSWSTTQTLNHQLITKARTRTLLPLASGRASLGFGCAASRFFSLGDSFGDDFFLNLLLIRVTTLAKFVDALVVDLVLPALVNPDEEDHVISESCKPVQPWHFDGECKQIIYECVQEFVGQRFSGHMGNGLLGCQWYVLKLEALHLPLSDS